MNNGHIIYGEFMKPLVRYKPTNADRIRAMSDEELAEARVRYDSFRAVWLDGRNNPCETKRIAVARELDWLKKEADNPELGGDT